ncbi:MAG: carbamoyltransferase HypF [Planctomycetota bacterium]
MSEAEFTTRTRLRIHINGIVQGVGFRPFVHRLARRHALSGHVRNTPEGVEIEVEGEGVALDRFCHELRKEAPPLARIVEMRVDGISALDEHAFTIEPSHRDERATTLISPDVATCDECLDELFDPSDRRHRFPFTNCTNCGPRYTIVRAIPYDRPNTSMSVFALCPACEREYHDPENRRFHAQPNACPACGPHLTLHDRTGERIDVTDPIREVVTWLKQGRIVALRGLGGFHLAVDARDDRAIEELRRRKGRAEKPFALMAPDLESVRCSCFVSKAEEKLLWHPSRPIVLLQARSHHGLSRSVAPGQRYLGFMLPYTPLHHILLREYSSPLVMTSGNFSEEPIAIGRAEAIERLAPIADGFLFHDRQILQRCDDSVARVITGEVRVIRRARGYVPSPVLLSTPARRRVLACGGELKNTIALSRDRTVFLSQHIGDLDNPSALAFFEQSIAHLQAILEIEPEVIACDMHPEYLSTRWAERQRKVPVVHVQHHHAHLLSVMAENGIDEECLGLILDGTGYGTDGTIWGGELLSGDARSFRRLAWLEPVPMPGGLAAIREPWRMAVSHLVAAFGANSEIPEIPFSRRLPRDKITIVRRMIERHLNAPMTSSCGRLFDAVAALLGVRDEITYEAQAAIELEMAIDETSCEQGETELYEEAVAGAAVPATSAIGALRVAPLVRAVVEDIARGEPKGRIAARFHHTLGEIFVRALSRARSLTGIARVGLSGGVFQNAPFSTYVLRRLQAEGFSVLTHREVPTNDGGIALGQVLIADAAPAQPAKAAARGG